MSGNLSRESGDWASNCFFFEISPSKWPDSKKQMLRIHVVKTLNYMYATCNGVINTLVDFTEHDDTGKLRVGISRNSWMEQEDAHSRTTRGHNIVVRFVDKNHN